MIPWYRHLPAAQGRNGVDGYPWCARWDLPGRVDIARSLVEYPFDERLAKWSVIQMRQLDSMLTREQAERAPAETQGVLL